MEARAELKYPFLMSATFNRQTEEITLNWGDDYDACKKMGEILLSAVSMDKTIRSVYTGGHEPPSDLLQVKERGGIPPADL